MVANWYTNFGLAHIREEGAPMHPEELDWEHYPSEGCSICIEKWNHQLKAWEDYQRSKGRCL